jgi:hypothetical protein
VVSFTSRSLYPEERALGTYWIGGWGAKSRSGRGGVENFQPPKGIEPSQSLYRLRYPRSVYVAVVLINKFYLSGLDDRGSRVRFPAGAGNFFLPHRDQKGSGAHPTSYPIGTTGSFPGGKAAGM